MVEANSALDFIKNNIPLGASRGGIIFSKCKSFDDSSFIIIKNKIL